MPQFDKIQSLARLYRDQFQKLFLYARAALQDPFLAEEAVQDTFLISCDKINHLMVSKNPPGWLMNTLKNVISNMERSRTSLYSFMRSTAEYNETVIGGQSDEIDVDLLYHGLVSDDDFYLLKQVVLEKCTYLEVARERGISLNACKKRIQRIKKQLREKLQKIDTEY
jgi:RNA polymerase sigma-70 factor (ECF subfamily)